MCHICESEKLFGLGLFLCEYESKSCECKVCKDYDSNFYNYKVFTVNTNSSSWVRVGKVLKWRHIGHRQVTGENNQTPITPNTHAPKPKMTDNSGLGGAASSGEASQVKSITCISNIYFIKFLFKIIYSSWTYRLTALACELTTC